MDYSKWAANDHRGNRQNDRKSKNSINHLMNGMRAWDIIYIVSN